MDIRERDFVQHFPQIYHAARAKFGSLLFSGLEASGPPFPARRGGYTLGGGLPLGSHPAGAGNRAVRSRPDVTPRCASGTCASA
jgi:hypothetical protein